MTRRGIRRFYQAVTVAAQDDGYRVLLNGNPARTPCGAPLCVPTSALAEAIAQEWRAQGEQLDRAGMKLTRLASAARDRVSAQRGEVIEHILGFGRSDLVCYRAETPPDLQARQSDVWDPLLAWVLTRRGIRLTTGSGVTHVEQPVDALLRMQEIVSDLDDFAIAAFDLAASLTGSFVVALALIDGRLGAEAVFTAAQLDELYQAEKWGRDAEAELRRNGLAEELTAAQRFVQLLRQG